MLLRSKTNFLVIHCAATKPNQDIGLFVAAQWITKKFFGEMIAIPGNYGPYTDDRLVFIYDGEPTVNEVEEISPALVEIKKGAIMTTTGNGRAVMLREDEQRWLDALNAP